VTPARRVRGVDEDSENCLQSRHYRDVSQSEARERPAAFMPRRGVYVLYYNSTNYYVGSSDDIDRRVAEHRNRQQTIANGGIRRELTPLTPARQDIRDWERAETLQRMLEHGIGRVRGWNYCSDVLSEANLLSIKDNIIGTFDLCHSCGYFGHFANECAGNHRMAGWLEGWQDLHEGLTFWRDGEEALTTQGGLAPIHPEGMMVERECVGCRADISDRPPNHFMCYACYRRTS
jgi:hypothetical protein